VATQQERVIWTRRQGGHQIAFHVARISVEKGANASDEDSIPTEQRLDSPELLLRLLRHDATRRANNDGAVRSCGAHC